MALIEGGKTVYGATLGILMLETRFPRIPGDMGHAATWPFPVQYRVVRGATPDRVVRGRAEGLLDAFVAAGRDLVRHGCDGITTNCGFLSLLQPELSEAIGVPVAASSLMQVPLVAATLPRGRRVGILTISPATLSRDHLEKIGVDPSTPVGGVDPGGEFYGKIIGDGADLDVDKCEEENVAAALALLKAHPEVGAIVLECTNMTPYAAAIRRACGVPVHTMVSFVEWFAASLAPRRFPGTA